MRRRDILIAIVLAALSWFGLIAQSVSAKDLTITLRPRESVRIPMKFWCLDFDKPFPAAIAGPTARAPDAVVKVLQAAMAPDTLTSNPYQTQLAIWKAADGTYHDLANEGHVVADQILSAASSLTLATLPAGALTLDVAIFQGKVNVTIQNFMPISDTAHPKLRPYNGTATVVAQNTSNQSVTFVLVEGAVFNPANGTNEQTLISHQDTSQKIGLPTTGDDGQPLQNLSWTLLAAGLLLLAFRMLISPRQLRKRSVPATTQLNSVLVAASRIMRLRILC